MRNLDKSSIVKAAADKEQLPIKVVQLDVTDDHSVKDAMRAMCQSLKE